MPPYLGRKTRPFAPCCWALLAGAWGDAENATAHQLKVHQPEFTNGPPKKRARRTLFEEEVAEEDAAG